MSIILKVIWKLRALNYPEDLFCSTTGLNFFIINSYLEIKSSELPRRLILFHNSAQFLYYKFS